MTAAIYAPSRREASASQGSGVSRGPLRLAGVAGELACSPSVTAVLSAYRRCNSLVCAVADVVERVGELGGPAPSSGLPRPAYCLSLYTARAATIGRWDSHHGVWQRSTGPQHHPNGGDSAPKIKIADSSAPHNGQRRTNRPPPHKSATAAQIGHRRTQRPAPRTATSTAHSDQRPTQRPPPRTTAAAAHAASPAHNGQPRAQRAPVPGLSGRRTAGGAVGNAHTAARRLGVRRRGLGGCGRGG
jgi:hypothetical protein